jgi:hypothetical protein
MFNEDKTTGRATEVFVGILTGFAALVLFLLLLMLVTNVELSVASVVGATALALLFYWFAQLSYRLILNKPKRTGGLLSPFAIKFWCSSFGLVAVVSCVFAIANWDVNLFFSSLMGIGACVAGWRVAVKRSSNPT